MVWWPTGIVAYSFELEHAYVDLLFMTEKYEHTYLAYYNSMATARVAAHSKIAWVKVGRAMQKLRQSYGTMEWWPTALSWSTRT